MENNKRNPDDEEASSSKRPKLISLNDAVNRGTNNQTDQQCISPQHEYSKNAKEFGMASYTIDSNDVAQKSDEETIDASMRDSICAVPSDTDNSLLNVPSNTAMAKNHKDIGMNAKRNISDNDASGSPAKQAKTTTGQHQGLKNSFHGVMYQLKLLTLLLCHAAKEMKAEETFEFEMTTEDPDGGKFDDIVFRFKNGDQCYCLCIQAKHKEDDTKTITLTDFISINGPFSITLEDASLNSAGHPIT